MRKLSVFCIAMLFAALHVTLAIADDAADSKKLVEQAVEMAKEKGVDATLKAVGDPKGALVKGDLYVFAGSLDKTTLLAHPFAAAKLVGPDLAEMKDSKGSQFFVKFKEVAQNPGSGWVEYWWPKPNEKEPTLKKTFIMRLPGQNVYFAAGYYPK